MMNLFSSDSSGDGKKNFQLHQCRGFEKYFFEEKDWEIAVVKATVEEVRQALAQLNSSARVYADVYAQPITAYAQGLVLFQLRGFEWTFVQQYQLEWQEPKVKECLSQLSRVLNTRAMFSSSEPTEFYLSHQVWDNGRSVERFLGDRQEFRDFQTAPMMKVTRLESELRSVYTGNMHIGDLGRFYREQDIYVPLVNINCKPSESKDNNVLVLEAIADLDTCLKDHLLRTGAAINYNERLEQQSLKRSDFEGFDYVTFDNSILEVRDRLESEVIQPEEKQENTVEDFQIERCRGVEPIVWESNSEINIIKAPVARVSQAMTLLYPNARVHARALGRTIQAKKRGVILMQFRGFEWTIIEDFGGVVLAIRHERFLSQLSEILQTRAMHLVENDEYAYLNHRVWDNGECVEHFDCKEVYDEANYDPTEFDEQGLASVPTVIRLESQIRQVKEEDAYNVENFYQEQGVYYPDFRITFERSRFEVVADFHMCLREQLPNLDLVSSFEPRLEAKHFEQFDYVTFET